MSSRPAGSRGSVPSGVVTFLLTDVQGSSRLWERQPEAMGRAMQIHDAVIEAAVSAHNGVKPVEQGEGDSAVVAFSQASRALSCALDVQRGLRWANWPPECQLRVRIAVHSGEALIRAGEMYAGESIARCARLRAVAHGGQTVLSRATVELTAGQLPKGVSVKGLGLVRLKDLSRAEEVFELIHPDLPSGFPPPRSLDAVPNNLPVQLSSFVGRDAELTEVDELLTAHRLVTLVGAGGCGKTRLAIQLAAARLEDYRDGAWWADLAPLSDPALVPGALAAALGVRDLPDHLLLATLVERLQDRRMLVVLDNCEHVVNEAARVGEELLRSCPGVSVLATSREPLGAEGESDYRVPSLDLPGADTSLEQGEACEAVRLFVERARAGRPSFALTTESWPAVVSICTQLDGMPLALELAAARTRHLSPEQIAEGLGSRFALLSGGRRTALPRQQTLQHSVDWSHDLLDDEERAVLRRASVFAGGFDLSAAETVCAADGISRERVLELLSRLVDKSLVQADEGDTAVRCRLLETIRQYAAQKLADADEGAAARGRHLGHYLALAVEAAAHLNRHEQLEWLDRLDAEHDNLRAAADWASASCDGDRFLLLCASLWAYWAYRHHLVEARDRLEAALAGGAGPPEVRGRALLALGDLKLLLGDFGGTYEPSAEALAIGRERSNLALVGAALGWIGWSEIVTGSPGVRVTLEKAVEIGRQVGDGAILPGTLPAMFDPLAAPLNALGFLELYRGRTGRARELCEEALEHGRARGDRKMIYMPLAWLGQLHTLTGEFARAESVFEDGLRSAGELGDPVFRSLMYAWRSILRMHMGGYAAAREDLERAVAIARENPNPLISAFAPGFTAWLDAWAGDPAEAHREVGEALAFTEGMGLRTYMVGFGNVAGEAAYAAGDLGAALDAWAGAASVARALGDPGGLGWALGGLALLARQRGEVDEAEGLGLEALQNLVGADHRVRAIDLLDLFAGLSADCDDLPRAARIIGAADAARDGVGYPRPPTLERRAAGDRERLAARELREERDAGAAMSFEEAVSYLSRGRGSRRRPAAGWASLTPAELAVVRLAAQGLTNPQIGARLFISKRTVQTHLSHVFAKVGVSSRAELAAEAARRDI